jgi:hypothetical protein
MKNIRLAMISLKYPYAWSKVKVPASCAGQQEKFNYNSGKNWMKRK